MIDDVCGLPTKGRFANLLDEAEYLGDMAAWQHNKMMSTGVSSMVEWNRIGYALERMEEIEGVLGEPAYRAFENVFDATIDFSTNADWRREVQVPSGGDDDLPF